MTVVMLDGLPSRIRSQQLYLQSGILPVGRQSRKVGKYVLQEFVKRRRGTGAVSGAPPRVEFNTEGEACVVVRRRMKI